MDELRRQGLSGLNLQWDVPVCLSAFRESSRDRANDLYVHFLRSYIFRLSTFPYIVTSMMDHSDDSSDAKINNLLFEEIVMNQIRSRVT